MSKGLHFPDNLMSIFGFKRVEEGETEMNKQQPICFAKINCPSCNQENDLYALPKNLQDDVLYYDDCNVCGNGFQYSLKGGGVVELVFCKHE